MRAWVYNAHTEIFPSPEEVTELCRPGAGEDTCVWLVVGRHGFECTAMNKPWALVERWRQGKTNAKRDGCERVNSWSPAGLSGMVEVPELDSEEKLLPFPPKKKEREQ